MVFNHCVVKTYKIWWAPNTNYWHFGLRGFTILIGVPHLFVQLLSKGNTFSILRRARRSSFPLFAMQRLNWNVNAKLPPYTNRLEFLNSAFFSNSFLSNQALYSFYSKPFRRRYWMCWPDQLSSFTLPSWRSVCTAQSVQGIMLFNIHMYLY